MSPAVKERVTKEKGAGERKDKRYRAKLQRRKGKTQDKEKERRESERTGRESERTGREGSNGKWREENGTLVGKQPIQKTGGLEGFYFFQV